MSSVTGLSDKCNVLDGPICLSKKRLEKVEAFFQNVSFKYVAAYTIQAPVFTE